MNGRSPILLGVLSLAVPAELGAQERAWVWTGDTLDGLMGNSLASVGDVDGDGHDDVLLGSTAGAFLISGRKGALLHEFQDGPNREVSYGLGNSVAGVEDMDGDGFRDLLISAPLTEPGSVGAAFVFSSATAEKLYEYRDGDFHSNFGRGVAQLGDIDGDGVRDFVIIEPFWPATGQVSGRGRVHTYSGRTGEALYNLIGSPGEHFGTTISDVGDITGDGLSEYIVGAPTYTGGPLLAQIGRAYVITGGEPPQVLYYYTGQVRYQKLGTSVSGAGDLNQDSINDFLIGMDYNLAVPGTVFVYSGADGSLLYELTGPEPGAFFGRVVSGNWDASGDGYPDILVGAPGHDSRGPNAGSAFLYSGRTGKLLYQFFGEHAQSYFGDRLLGAGDVNGDGMGDLLIAATLFDFPRMQAGRAYVFLGNDLYLQALPRSVREGESLFLHVRGGPPGARALVHLKAIDGREVSMPVGNGVLDEDGNWTLELSIPVSTLHAQKLEFEAYAEPSVERVNVLKQAMATSYEK